MNAKWSQISNDDLKASEEKPSSPHPKRKQYQLADEMPYMPKVELVKALEALKGEQPKPLPLLSPKTAQGIVAFVQRANKPHSSEAKVLSDVWNKNIQLEAEKPAYLAEYQQYDDGKLTLLSPLRVYYSNIFTTSQNAAAELLLR